MPIVGKFPRRRNKQIPAWIGFQATAGDNTLHLRPQTGGFDCTIYWGDGSKTTAPVNGGNVIHSYASAGLYDIKLTGKSFAGFYVNNQVGKEKYVAAYSMGKWAVDTMIYLSVSFYGCTLLTTISDDIFKYNTNVTSVAACFRKCTNLKNIPADLFKYNGKMQSVDSCFKDCISISTISPNLFKYVINAYHFGSCFNGCAGLTSIPPDLYRYNVAISDLSNCFEGCTNLISIPADLFKYNNKAYDFTRCFEACNKLITIPAGLFQYNTNANLFSSCFRSCTSLTTIPAGLFQYNTNAYTFTYCFEGCTNLTTTPPDLFRYNIVVNGFTRCFENCNKLMLRTDIFGTDYATRFNGKAVDFEKCFYRTSFNGTQGTAPALWNFTGLTATKTNCFGGAGNNVSSISNYSSIPADWIN